MNSGCRHISTLSLLILLSISSYFLKAQANYSFEQLSWVPPTAKVNKIIKSQRSGIFVLTDSGLYLKDKNDQIIFTHHGKNINALSETKEEDYIVSHKHQILDRSEKIIYAVDSTSKINALYAQGSIIWIGTTKGLYKFNMTTGKGEEQTSRNSKFEKSAVNFIHRDGENNLWIGSKNGDYRITKDKWKKYNNGKNVLDFFENIEGVWFASADDMWLVDLKNRLYPVGLGKGLTKGELNDFTIDSKGNLYFASDQLTAYNPYNNKITSYEEEAALLSKKTTALLWTGNSLLAGTNGFGLYELRFSDDPQLLTINLLVSSTPTCHDKNDGVAEAFIKGGTPPYQIKWSGNNENSTKITNVPAGELIAEVTDANGDKQKKSIIVGSPPVPIPEVKDIIKPSVNGSNGSISLKPMDQYSYSWTNGQSGPMATQLSKGRYGVSVTDPKKCTTVQFFNMEESAEQTNLKEQKDTAKTVPADQYTSPKPFLDSKLFVKGKTIILDQIQFMADSTEVTVQSLPTLDELYQLLNKNPTLKIEIGGHTNTIPPHAYCDQLSTARAKNIAEYFYLRGLPQNRISYKGYGKRRPLTSSTTEEGRRLNQRVEIRVLEN